MTNFNWHRRPISPIEYEKQMDIPYDKGTKTEFTVSVNKDNNECYTVKIGQDLLDALYGSKHLSAYTVAADIRKFEIDKYWQRTLYFWGFITAIYMAYFNVLKEFYYNECTGKRLHGSLPLVILSALGLFFCVSWLLASKGSKHWQENWENHLDLLEDDITGPLYKTYLAGVSFSVSAINITAGWVLSVCAYGLFMFECINFVGETLKLTGIVAMAVSAVFMLFTAVAILVYANQVKGNSNDAGSIEFDIKEYGERKCRRISTYHS